MMALSGVIRPSYSEVRYGTSLASLRTVEQSHPSHNPLTGAKSNCDTPQIWEWLRTTSKSVLQLDRDST